MKQHRWWGPRGFGWFQFCVKCGLLSLKNEATQKCIRKGCKYDDEE